MHNFLKKQLGELLLVPPPLRKPKEKQRRAMHIIKAAVKKHRSPTAALHQLVRSSNTARTARGGSKQGGGGRRRAEARHACAQMILISPMSRLYKNSNKKCVCVGASSLYINSISLGRASVTLLGCFLYSNNINFLIPRKKVLKRERSPQEASFPFVCGDYVITSLLRGARAADKKFLFSFLFNILPAPFFQCIIRKLACPSFFPPCVLLLLATLALYFLFLI